MKQMLNSAGAGEKQLLAIEGYEVLKELGRGGMGAVYLARPKSRDEQVALKILLPQVAAAPQVIKRFLREIEMMKLLRHPHIVRLYATGCHQGTFFLTLEYCNGGSVDDLMRARGKPLSAEEAVPIIIQVLEGLNYAHRVDLSGLKLNSGKDARGHGLVHRDVKPSNIFLCASHQGVTAKLGDYGLAKAFDLAGLSGHTRADAVGGTPCFMPRQQVLRFKYAKPEVDVWAAAASLYHMLTGWFPRHFPEGEDPWLTVLQSEPVPLRKRFKHVPVRLARVIDEALVDDPQIKIKSAAELKRALEEAMQ
jgi:eukaryotic-like serine/threonine-protein kinase